MPELSKTVYISDSYHPAENLGFEDYLMSICREDEVILYLWQNQKTIVIGKHQNPHKECNLARVKEDGIHLVRRKSGGGAVFHDLGNLNFTFIAHRKHYDQDKHYQVILEGLKPWGIIAEQTGRNDIAIDGKKFSGNAFLHQKDFSCHHGTILVDVNMQELGRYLMPPKIKLTGKSVDSVRSRVVNLRDLNEQLTIDGLKTSLLNAFDQAYQGPLSHRELPHSDSFREHSSTYFDWLWTIGKSPKATYKLGSRFDWGTFVMDLAVKNGHIQSCIVSSDTLLDLPIAELSETFSGLKLDQAEIHPAIDQLFTNVTIAADLKQLLAEIV